ncbi:hypothetical protein TorRG33x02_188240 [Trema orientale]|uniref:Uncharacterized protein n=1 Tax=Trema orientale TaxID=63057 RepID=A0A2P5EIR5_TREOI|nr:hypothetical protein TorRG33x02_188240 [Trema orientale]
MFNLTIVGAKFHPDTIEECESKTYYQSLLKTWSKLLLCRLGLNLRALGLGVPRQLSERISSIGSSREGSAVLLALDPCAFSMATHTAAIL